MPISPIITFKAGQCELNTSSRPYKATPEEKPGYIYLYSEDELVHFCWRERSASLDDPELDLVMVPGDGSFLPYEASTIQQPTAKTNGRIFALKFASSSQRYLYWLQSKPQGRDGDASWLSPRDRKIGEVVHKLLQGEEVSVNRELAALRNVDSRRDDDDDDDDDEDDEDEDEDMEDVDSRQTSQHRQGTGGAGRGAGGNATRREGGGGGSGGQASSSDRVDASEAVKSLLNSLKGQPGSSSGTRQRGADLPYPFLSHLLPSSITVKLIEDASNELLETLLGLLPQSLLLLAGNVTVPDARVDPPPDQVEVIKAGLSIESKRSLLKKVARSPQFHQALGGLTMAIRDGGLPSIADALGIQVDNGGYISGGGMPLGGGLAVKTFIEGIKKTSQDST